MGCFGLREVAWPLSGKLKVVEVELGGAVVVSDVVDGIVGGVDFLWVPVCCGDGACGAGEVGIWVVGDVGDVEEDGADVCGFWGDGDDEAAGVGVAHFVGDFDIEPFACRDGGREIGVFPDGVEFGHGAVEDVEVEVILV